MRSHPGQVSFPGGSLDPGETAREAALREAEEETGLDPAGVDVFAELPPLWLPPSNFAVTPVLGWWREPSAGAGRLARRGARGLPGADLASCATRRTGSPCKGPAGWTSPGFLIGDDNDVICWGFTAGIIARLFEYLGWIEDLPDAPEQELPGYMLAGRRLNRGRACPTPSSSSAAADEPARLAARRARRWPTRSPATGRASSPAPSPPPGCCSAACSASGSRRSRSATPTRRCWSRSARCSS